MHSAFDAEFLHTGVESPDIMSLRCTILAQGLDVQIIVHSLINADSKDVPITHQLNCHNINMVYSIFYKSNSHAKTARQCWWYLSNKSNM